MSDEKTITKHIVRRTARKSAKRIKALQGEANQYGAHNLEAIDVLNTLSVGVHDAVYVRGPRKNIFRYRVVAVSRRDQPTPGPRHDASGRFA